MIVVDTSVWISFFRGSSPTIISGLRARLEKDEVALPAPVLVELLAGAGRADGPKLKRVLSALPQWRPGHATWTTLETWAATASARGQRFGVGDLLIAGIAAENGAAVWSLDGNFARMNRLGFVRLFTP